MDSGGSTGIWNASQDSAAYFGFRYDEAAVRNAIEQGAEGLIGAHAVRLELDRLGVISVMVDPESLDPARWWPHPARDHMECSINTRPISSNSIYRFHKTTARRPYRDRREMHEGVDEVLLVNERGELTEGTRRNVAVFCGGVWITPPLASGCLPGVLRQILIDEGRTRRGGRHGRRLAVGRRPCAAQLRVRLAAGADRRAVASPVMPTPPVA